MRGRWRDLRSSVARAEGTQVKVCGYDILFSPLFCKAVGTTSLLLDVRKVAEQLSSLAFRQCHLNKIRGDKCMYKQQKSLKCQFCLAFQKKYYFPQCCSSSESLGACICSLLDARPPAENNVSQQVVGFFHLDLKCQIMQSFESGSKRRMKEVKQRFCFALAQHGKEMSFYDLSSLY